MFNKYLTTINNPVGSYEEQIKKIMTHTNF